MNSTVNAISFPLLKIGEMHIDRVAFSIGGFNVYWYGIIIGIGFVLAVLYALHRTKSVGLTHDNVFDICIIGIPVSIIFARLFYIIGDIGSMNSFADIFKIHNGGLSIIGGITGILITGLTYSKAKNIEALKLFDFAVPSVMIGQIVGRWGNFVNAEVYGKETVLPWGMKISKVITDYAGTQHTYNVTSGMVHPLFLYESLWMLLGLILVIMYQDNKRKNGTVVSFYLIWYGAGRIINESLRADEYVLKIAGAPISLIMAAAMIVSGAAMLGILKKPMKKTVNILDKIVMAREELDAAIENNRSAQEVLDASLKLDKLIEEYMESTDADAARTASKKGKAKQSAKKTDDALEKSRAQSEYERIIAKEAEENTENKN